MTTQNNSHTNLYLFKSVIRTFKRYVIPAVIIALLFGKTAVAQDRTITLDEAIKLGVESSNVVKLSHAKIDEAISQYEQAKDKSKPTASASFGYDRAEILANKLDLGPTSFALPKNDNAWLGILSFSETI